MNAQLVIFYQKLPKIIMKYNLQIAQIEFLDKVQINNFYVYILSK